jgi:hypothetical protein
VKQNGGSKNYTILCTIIFTIIFAINDHNYHINSSINVCGTFLLDFNYFWWLFCIFSILVSYWKQIWNKYRILDGCEANEWDLTNIKHFPCLYTVISTRVEIGKTRNCVETRRHECWYNCISIQKKFYIFFIIYIAQRNIKKEIFRVDIELYQHGS